MQRQLTLHYVMQRVGLDGAAGAPGCGWINVHQAS